MYWRVLLTTQHCTNKSYVRSFYSILHGIVLSIESLVNQHLNLNGVRLVLQYIHSQQAQSLIELYTRYVQPFHLRKQFLLYHDTFS